MKPYQSAMMIKAQQRLGVVFRHIAPVCNHNVDTLPCHIQRPPERFPDNPHNETHDPVKAKRRIMESKSRFWNRNRLAVFPRAFFEKAAKRKHSSQDASLATLLPGPLNDKKKYPSLVDVLAEFERHRVAGSTHELAAKWACRYCTDGLSGNFVQPALYKAPKLPACVRLMVVLGNPSDCERIARNHIKKPEIYQMGFYHSVISTNDVGYWRKSRRHLNEAFLPLSSLSKIFHITAARAEEGSKRLAGLASDGHVDMSDFYLHETQAQLQLALLGMPRDFMNRTNAPLRSAFAFRNPNRSFLKHFLIELVEKMHAPGLTSPSDVAAIRACPFSARDSQKQTADCPVRGPLSRQITSLDSNYETKIGNAHIFAFAGHDTTGHSLAFLTMELARNPKVQRRLQSEVDAFWRGKSKEYSLQYADLKSFPFMTRCVHETLRLWPAVPNGTFRVLESQDYCMGNDGNKVILPKGTMVQISTWLRHRNSRLWGETANMFDPDRAFTPTEIWHDKGFSAQNPATPRFSPFTHAPRDCIGKNFAQMEMRAILACVLRDFSFELAPAVRGPPAGVNRSGTMGPKNIWNTLSYLKVDARRVPRTTVGLLCKVTKR